MMTKMMKQLLVLVILCAMAVGAFWLSERGQIMPALVLLGLIFAVIVKCDLLYY
jgi:hypothetical protein